MALLLGGDRTGRDGPWIGETGFGVTSQRQSRQYSVQKGINGRNTSCLRQKGRCDGTVPDEKPNQARHERSCGI